MARRGSFTFPILLLALGVLLLLSNLGVLSWGAWQEIVRLWPVFLIALGIDLLFARRGGRGWIGGAILVIVVLFAAMAIFDAAAPAGWTVREQAAIEEALQGATTAEVSLVCGAGPVRISAGSDPTLLASGTADLRWDEDLERSREDSEGRAVLRVERSAHFPFHVVRSGGRFDLVLNPAVLLELDVRMGAGSAYLDLSGLTLRRVEVRAGAGDTTVVLPARGTVTARVEGGVGQVTVLVPEGVALRVVAEGLGKVEIPEGLASDGDTHVSPGYDAAGTRIDLEAHVGIGHLVVRRAAP
jgi:hypothetical protein